MTTKCGRPGAVVLALAIVGLFIASSAGAQVMPGYQAMSHTSPTGVYATMVPQSYGAIETLNEEMPSPVGMIVGSGYQVINEYASVAMLALIHYQAPAGFEQGRTQEQILQDTLNGLVGGLGGTISAQRPATFNGSTGVEADFAAYFEGLSLVGRVRIFLTGNEAVGVYYIAMGTGDPSSDAILLVDPTGNAFINSLAFTAAAPTP